MAIRVFVCILIFIFPPLYGEGQQELRIEAEIQEGLPDWVKKPGRYQKSGYHIFGLGISGDFQQEDEALAKVSAEKKAMESISSQIIISIRAEQTYSGSDNGSESFSQFAFQMESFTQSVMRNCHYLEYYQIRRYGKIRYYVLAGIGAADFQDAQSMAEKEFERVAAERDLLVGSEERAKEIFNTFLPDSQG